MMNERRRWQPNVGIISLSVIFAVLILTIFAVLSITTSRNEMTQAIRASESVISYYATDLECSEVANEFFTLWKKSGTEADLISLCEQHGATYIKSSVEEVKYHVSFSRVIDSTRQLDVELVLGVNPRVISWKTTSLGDWTPNDDLSVWDGDSHDE